MLSIARNPFNYTPRQLNNAYKSKSIAPTLNTRQLTNHLQSLKNCDAISHAVSVDIDSFSSPLSQNLIDIWHQSNLPWNEFRHSTQILDNLWKEENGSQSNTILNGYHAQFTRNIYAPLISEYVNKQQPYLLNGDSNLLLQQITDVYDHFLKQRRRQLSPNHSLQIDIRSMNPLQKSPYLDNDTEDDEDDYCQSMVYNTTKFKPCFISNHDKYKNNLVSKMRECIPRFDHDHKSFCYKRYEILLYGEEFQIVEANTNNQIPNYSYQHPLPKIYNAIEGFDTHQPGLLTFTFLVDHDCIRVYTMLADGTRQLYGTRIFKHDLIQTIPKLFEHQNLSKTTQGLLDRLQFTPDRIYDEYYKCLGMVKTKSIDIDPHSLNPHYNEMQETKEQDEQDADSEAEYDPYDDHLLFDGLLDQSEIHDDEKLYLQQETHNYLLQQLEKSKNELMDLSNEISIFEDYNVMDDIQINEFNDKKIESGLELPSGW